MFLDLAGGRFWQRTEDKMLRGLKMRHVASAKEPELFGVCFHARFKGHERARGFAPDRVRTSDHSGFEDGGVAVEHGFDLDAGDVLAA